MRIVKDRDILVFQRKAREKIKTRRNKVRDIIRNSIFQKEKKQDYEATSMNLAICTKSTVRQQLPVFAAAQPDKSERQSGEMQGKKAKTPVQTRKFSMGHNKSNNVVRKAYDF